MKKLFIVAALVLCSCAPSMNDVLTAHKNGKEDHQIYPVNFDRAWEIARTVLRWENADVIEEHKDEAYMLTSTHDFASGGALVGVFLDRIDSSSTKISVTYKSKVAMPIAKSFSTSDFHQKFSQAVDIIKAGKPLPIEPPSRNN